MIQREWLIYYHWLFSINLAGIEIYIKLISDTELNIIEKVNGISDWINAIVLVRKPIGKLTICLDPK